MSHEFLNTTSMFFKAAASYFGIPYDQLRLGGQSADIAGTMNVRFEIMLTPDDLIRIAARMEEMLDPEAQIDKLVGQDEQFEPEGMAGMEWRTVTENVGDVIRNPEAFFGKPEYVQLVERACKLSKAVREKHTEWAQDEARMAIGGPPALKVPSTPATNTRNDVGNTEMVAEPTEGVGGRKVQHVDVPEQEDADSGLPAAVWVDGAGLTAIQKQLASDCDLVEHRYLVPVTMLTPEQKAEYCGEQKP